MNISNNKNSNRPYFNAFILIIFSLYSLNLNSKIDFKKYIVCFTNTVNESFKKKYDEEISKFGSESLTAENEKCVKEIIAELNITKPIIIRKMNWQALQTDGRKNAFAIYPNYIFISESFFEELSKHEQKFLIGHELMHLELGHLQKRIIHSGIELAIIGIPWITYKFTKSFWNSNIAQIIFPSFSLVSARLAFKIYEAEYNRKQELEADRESALRLNCADDGIHFLKKYLKEEEIFKLHKWYNIKKIFMDHPLIEKRIEQLEKIKQAN